MGEGNRPHASMHDAHFILIRRILNGLVYQGIKISQSFPSFCKGDGEVLIRRSHTHRFSSLSPHLTLPPLSEEGKEKGTPALFLLQTHAPPPFYYFSGQVPLKKEKGATWLNLPSHHHNPYDSKSPQEHKNNRYPFTRNNTI